MKKIIPILFLLSLIACNRTPVIENEQESDQSRLEESLLNANKYIAQSEETQIDGYISRRGWKMQQITCGARYEEYTVGKGPMIDYEDKVTLKYSVGSINGTTLYENQTEQVVVGRGKPNVGLDAVLRHLHRGSTAHVILPSESAYGVVGDGDRIGSRMILVYDLTVE